MGFEEIIGQSRAIDDLQAAFERGRIPNAYLFAGPAGIGKMSTALILARLVNCESPRSDIQPCDVCTACRKITHGNHPDIWTVEPVKSTIKIKQVREMQRLVRFAPQEGRMRIVIFDGVEKMNQESSNAFLKTLEEPPPDNLFILISSLPSQLLPTIISRCQRVPFGPIKRRPLQELLVEKHGFDPIAAELAAGISEGSVGRSLELDELLSGDERRIFLRSLPELHQGPQGALLAMELAEKMAKDLEHIEQFFTLLRIWFRDLMFVREVPDADTVLINLDLRTTLQEHAALLSTRAIVHIIRLLEQTEASLKRNAAPQLTLERFFLSCTQATSARFG